MFDKNKIPFFSKLYETASHNAIRFHMPGHKGKPIFPDGVLLESIDYTELAQTGNLYENSYPFNELNALFSHDYGAAKSFVIAGGATQAIHSMIACIYSGKKNRGIVCERAAHKCVYNAMTINRLEPIYLYPSITGAEPFCNIACDFDESNLSLILENSHAAAVLITSPNYYGAIKDIKKLAHIAHSYGALLLVDEAHGAHLPYLENRSSAISQGADMSVCSLHKTMRALGGAALLNSSDAFDSETILYYLSVFGSSSPSYLILASADLARADIKTQRKKLCDTVYLTEEIRDTINKHTPFAAFGREYSAYEQGYDPLRLTINTVCGGICGKDAALFLEENGIICEMSDIENLIFIISYVDSTEELTYLRDKIIEMGKHRNCTYAENTVKPVNPVQVLPLWEAMTGNTEYIRLKDAVNRISADIICKAPPCIPLIAPGELISKVLIDYTVSCGIDPHLKVRVLK